MGWAYYSTLDRKPHYGEITLDAYSEENGETMGAAYEAIYDLVDHFKPRLMVNEAPMPVAIQTWNASQRRMEYRVNITNDAAINCLRGLIMVMRLVGFQTSTGIAQYAVQTVRTVMKGFPMKVPKKGNGKNDWKPVVLAFCRLCGFEPQGDNAADAIVGLIYTVQLHEGVSLLNDLGRVAPKM